MDDILLNVFCLIEIGCLFVREFFLWILLIEGKVIWILVGCCCVGFIFLVCVLLIWFFVFVKFKLLIFSVFCFLLFLGGVVIFFLCLLSEYVFDECDLDVLVFCFLIWIIFGLDCCCCENVVEVRLVLSVFGIKFDVWREWLLWFGLLLVVIGVILCIFVVGICFLFLVILLNVKLVDVGWSFFIIFGGFVIILLGEVFLGVKNRIVMRIVC